MDEAFSHHLQRLRMSTVDRLSRANTSQWIEENTKIGGRRWSWDKHEFQLRIADEQATEIVVAKAAQLGVSELSLRMALAWMMMMPAPFSVAYTFPTASFASQYSRTRFDPIVQSSPAARAAMASADMDNSEIKSFGPERTLYFKGAATGNAAISDSLHAIIHDEVDFSDQDVLGAYSSRLIHSPHKWRMKISTPTTPGGPIMQAFESSQRWHNMCKCHLCGHYFWPTYYEHMVVPGWGNHLDEITEENLNRVRHADAYIQCPACKGRPSLLPPHREWVCENPDEGYRAVGIRLSPFDAPRVQSPSDLIVASTTYSRKTLFRQFALGQPDEDSENGFTLEDLEGASFIPSDRPDGTYFLGFDQGLVCHIAVGCVDNGDCLKVVHWERVHLSNFRKRYTELKARFGVQNTTCGDMYPNVSMSMQMVDEDSQFFPATYVTRQGMDIFEVKLRDADDEEGQTMLRQVKVARSLLFDRLMLDVRTGKLLLGKTSEWEHVTTHMQDMKRASATLRASGEYASVWQKSAKGNDHYMHALGYLWLAAQMRGVGGIRLSPSMFSVGKLKIAQPA